MVSGQGVVVTVADAAHGWLAAGFGQPFGVFDRDILAPPVAAMHEAAAMDRPAFMQSLLKSVEHDAGMCRSRHTPADDEPGVDIDDKGNVDEPGPGRDKREIRDPERIWPWHLELAVDVVQRARCRLVADRGFHRFASDNALRCWGGRPHGIACHCLEL